MSFRSGGEFLEFRRAKEKDRNIKKSCLMDRKKLDIVFLVYRSAITICTQMPIKGS